RSVVAGGSGVVPDSVLRALPGPRRVAGSDRYATGTAVATWARGLVPASSVLLSSGQPAALVDTLSGGQFGRITLYAMATSMPSTTAAWLDAAPGLTSVTVLGGTGVLNDLVAGRAQRAVLQ
ncbi:MAG TPA: cell wall-binding repeat-containing protein, partial [Pedococcus sp.]|nr:cell wall-binding repeat-containing protein [Pedococcus sp.]